MDFKRQVKNKLQSIFSDRRLYGSKVLVSSIDRTNPSIQGTFIDPSNNRVFQFEITKDTAVTYKPNISIQDSETNSTIINRLDAYSAGFSSVVLRDNTEAAPHLDGIKCSEANLYPCGGYCIELKKPCIARSVEINNLSELIDFVFNTSEYQSNY